MANYFLVVIHELRTLSPFGASPHPSEGRETPRETSIPLPEISHHALELPQMNPQLYFMPHSMYREKTGIQTMNQDTLPITSNTGEDSISDISPSFTQPQQYSRHSFPSPPLLSDPCYHLPRLLSPPIKLKPHDLKPFTDAVVKVSMLLEKRTRPHIHVSSKILNIAKRERPSVSASESNRSSSPNSDQSSSLRSSDDSSTFDSDEASSSDSYSTSDDESYSSSSYRHSERNWKKHRVVRSIIHRVNPELISKKLNVRVHESKRQRKESSRNSSRTRIVTPPPPETQTEHQSSATQQTEVVVQLDTTRPSTQIADPPKKNHNPSRAQQDPSPSQSPPPTRSPQPHSPRTVNSATHTYISFPSRTPQNPSLSPPAQHYAQSWNTAVKPLPLLQTNYLNSNDASSSVSLSKPQNTPLPSLDRTSGTNSTLAVKTNQFPSSHMLTQLFPQAIKVSPKK